jgi:hypothetical protein
MMLINAGTLAQGLQIGFPNSTVSFFSALGRLQGHKVHYLSITWGRLKIFFLFQPLLLV